MKIRILILTTFLALTSLSSFAQTSGKEIGVGVSNLLGTSTVGILYRKHNEKSSFRLRANPFVNFGLSGTNAQTSLGGGSTFFIGKQKNVDLGKNFSLYYGLDAYLSAAYNGVKVTNSNSTGGTVTDVTQSNSSVSFAIGPAALGGVSWKFHDRLALSFETHFGLILQESLLFNKTRTVISDGAGTQISDTETSTSEDNFSARLRWIAPGVFLSYFF